MALTVDGFVAPRSPVLQGKGGIGGRRDNGVSPTLPADVPSVAEGRDASVVLAEPSSLPRTRTQRKRNVHIGTGHRAWQRASHSAPAALEWRDLRVPILGRLWATAWLPSILLAACLVALVYLVQISGVATTGYDIQRLQTERDDWQLRNEQLQLELAKRQSLTWIESEATGRLGMVRAEPTALAYVKVAR